jgi:hypothetical protein
VNLSACNTHLPTTVTVSCPATVVHVKMMSIADQLFDYVSDTFV